MARPGNHQRMFVGAYPPGAAAAEILGLLAGLDLPEHSRTSPEQLHLTLQFIGDVPEREVGEVVESVRRSAAGIEKFALRATGLVTLPERGTPRLIALETDAPAGIVEVHRRLAHRLAREGGRGGERGGGDRFLPHLTLCRFRHGAATRVDRPVELPPFEIGEIRLMRSVLRPSGAEHYVVEAVPLAGD